MLSLPEKFTEKNLNSRKKFFNRALTQITNDCGLSEDGKLLFIAMGVEEIKTISQLEKPYIGLCYKRDVDKHGALQHHNRNHVYKKDELSMKDMKKWEALINERLA